MREQDGADLIGRMLAHCQVLQVEGTAPASFRCCSRTRICRETDLDMGMEDAEPQDARGLQVVSTPGAEQNTITAQGPWEA